MPRAFGSHISPCNSPEFRIDQGRQFFERLNIALIPLEQKGRDVVRGHRRDYRKHFDPLRVFHAGSRIP